MTQLPDRLPATGIGEPAAASIFNALIDARSARLDAPDAFAHMDPPPAAIAAEIVALNARLNQNLLHPELSPFAGEAERRVIRWLAPEFGQEIGHLCAGSTLANLTALWCAREHGATTVVTSADAHVSVRKSADLLGMPLLAVATDSAGRLERDSLPELGSAALVLTAGTTGRGAVDELGDYDALWTHVDAAWAGPLRLTRYAERLAGIEAADSVAISAHKWLFQPKDSALILFARQSADEPIRYGGSYLAAPNVGVQGSRGANGIPLLATLLAYGRDGIGQRIERCMQTAEALAARLADHAATELRQSPTTGVVNWRPTGLDTADVAARLTGTASMTTIDDEPWLRHAAANPAADIDVIWQRIEQALRR